jgi:hypothetical protein
VATTTTHAPAGNGESAPPSAAAPRSGSEPSGPNPTRGRLANPARLWAALIAAVVAFLAIGGTCAATLATRQASETHAAGSSEQLVQNVNELYHALAEADATAATALLTGPVPPTRLTDLYNSDVDQAVTALSTASRELAGDSAASAQLSKVAGQLPLYTANIATAQANNRLGYPVAVAYLHQASKLMHDQILAEVQSVADEESAAQRSGQAAVSGFPTWIIVVGVLAAAVLFLSGRELSRITHRRFNAGVLAGALIALAVVIWSLVATSSASSKANRAEAAFDNVAATLANRDSLARTALFQSLTLVDRGEDGGSDLDNEQSAFQQIKPSSLEDTVKIAYGQLNDDLNQVQQSVSNGDYYGAVELVVGHGAAASPKTVIADASVLDNEFVDTFKAYQREYTSDADAAGSALSGGLLAGLIGGVLAALAAAYGINRRLAEYR